MVVDGVAVSAFDNRARLGPGKGRHLVLQSHQFIGDVGRKKVGAGGKRLPKLDEHRTQLLQRFAQAAGARRTGGVIIAPPGDARRELKRQRK